MSGEARRASTTTTDPSYATLKDVVVRATGLAYYEDKDDLFRERLQRRLVANGIDNFADYLRLITGARADRAEFEGLVADLTIGETCFFRDPAQLAVLRNHVLPECLDNNACGKILKIWSAGCSTGAEPYSIAILLAEMLGAGADNWQVRIVGTDINLAYLEHARQGLFGDWAVRNVPEGLRHQYFSRSGRFWRVRDCFRRHVSFVPHNLSQDTFPPVAAGITEFDVVLCRNVMIYFSDETNRRLVDSFEQSIRPGGWLLLGPAEASFYLNERFAPTSIDGAHVHRKQTHPEAPERATTQERGEPVSGHASRQAPARRRSARSSVRAGQISQRSEQSPLARARTHAEPLERPGWLERPEDGLDGQPEAPPPFAANPVAAAAAEHPRNAKVCPAVAEPSPLEDIMALANRGAWSLVAERCRGRLHAAPFDTGAYYYLAIGLQGMGAIAEAEDALRRAIYLDRDLALAHYQLGVHHAQAGDPVGSERFFRNTERILERLDDASIVSFCGQVRALDLRRIVTLQLERLVRP